MSNDAISVESQPVVTITGGRGDLALSIRQRFLQGNWHVDSPGRSELDVTDALAVSGYFLSRNPDLLICNAGMIRDAIIPKLDEPDWQRVMEVNFHGARRCAVAALDGMLRRGSGHVVFISSNSAIHPRRGQSAYSAAKAALLGLTRDLAREVGNQGVRVNAILPGFLETKMTSSLSHNDRESVRASHALGQFNEPDVVASFIWHLHHDLIRTSGQFFQLDSRTD